MVRGDELDGRLAGRLGSRQPGEGRAVGRLDHRLRQLALAGGRDGSARCLPARTRPRARRAALDLDGQGDAAARNALGALDRAGRSEHEADDARRGDLRESCRREDRQSRRRSPRRQAGRQDVLRGASLLRAVDEHRVEGGRGLPRRGDAHGAVASLRREPERPVVDARPDLRRGLDGTRFALRPDGGESSQQRDEGAARQVPRLPGHLAESPPRRGRGEDLLARSRAADRARAAASASRCAPRCACIRSAARRACRATTKPSAKSIVSPCRAGAIATRTPASRCIRITSRARSSSWAGAVRPTPRATRCSRWRAASAIPKMLERGQRSLDWLAHSPFNEHGFLLNYDADTGQWKDQDPVSQGQAMEVLRPRHHRRAQAARREDEALGGVLEESLRVAGEADSAVELAAAQHGGGLLRLAAVQGLRAVRRRGLQARRSEGRRVLRQAASRHGRAVLGRHARRQLRGQGRRVGGVPGVPRAV